MTTVIYPGTFDPITNGHADLVSRASGLFSHVIIAIAEDGSKKPFFTFQERIALAEAALSKYKNVEVCGFDGLLANFAKARDVNVILRGVRMVSDVEYELQQACMNRQLMPALETLFLAPTEQFAYLSSSLVREVALLGGDVSGFVHPAVVDAFAKRGSRK